MRPNGDGPRAGIPVVLTGMAVTTGYGRGVDAFGAGVFSGVPAFVPVDRFDASRHRVGIAAQLPGPVDLDEELVSVTEQACAQAGLTAAQRADTPVLLARHADPALSRLPRARQVEHPIGWSAERVSAACGLGGAGRTYINACVAASTAVSEAAALIAAGRRERVVVVAGHLVDPESFTTFDAGRALAADGLLRPFSTGRKGLLLGDGAGAVVLEAAGSRPGTEPLARISGWGMAGDAHHVCQPHPDGLGMARAIGNALRRAGVRPDELDYVNAHGTGTPYNDKAEAAALRLALGADTDRVPVSSTKSLHGHTLQAAGMVELVVCVLALLRGRLPVNASFLAPDPECDLDLVLDEPRAVDARHVLSLNAAFGGANTALVVSAA